MNDEESKKSHVEKIKIIIWNCMIKYMIKILNRIDGLIMTYKLCKNIYIYIYIYIYIIYIQNGWNLKNGWNKSLLN